MHQLLHPALQRLNDGGQVHPSPETMAGFLEGNLSPQQREVLFAHLAACQECRLQLAVQSDTPRSRSRISGGYWAASLAASLCVVTGLWFVHGLTAVHPKTPRSPNPPGVPSASFIAGALTTLSGLEKSEPAPEIDWRFSGPVQEAKLQKSTDSGKTWAPAQVAQTFQPELLVWTGPRAWVRGRDGRTLLSRDAGLHWAESRTLGQVERTEMFIQPGSVYRTGRVLQLITSAGDRWIKTKGKWQKQKATRAPLATQVDPTRPR